MIPNIRVVSRTPGGKLVDQQTGKVAIEAVEYGQEVVAVSGLILHRSFDLVG